MRNIICAQYNRSVDKNIEVTFNVDQLDISDHIAINYIVQFCKDFTHYPWDISDSFDADTLAEYVHTQGTTPPLPPILRHNEKTGYYLEIIRMKPETFVDEISEKFRCQIITYLKNAYNTLKIHNASDEIRYQKQVNRIDGNNFLRKENLLHKRQACAKLQKKLTTPLYKGVRSLWPRVLGLMLWQAYSNLCVELNLRRQNTSQEEKPVFKNILSKVTGAPEVPIAQMNNDFEMLSNYIHSTTADDLLLHKILYDTEHPAQKIYEERNAQRWFEATVTSIQQGIFTKI